MIGAPGAGRIPAITGSRSHLHPYLGPCAPKLPGDGAPPVEPPPALKERLMAVVHAEVHAAGAPAGPVTLRASASSAAAPAAGALVTVSAAGALLRVWGLPAPDGGAGAARYRVWLLHGASPRVPQPGPVLALDARGCAEVALGALGATAEVAVAPEDDEGPARGEPVLRIGLPPGVAARAGR